MSVAAGKAGTGEASWAASPCLSLKHASLDLCDHDRLHRSLSL